MHASNTNKYNGERVNRLLSWMVQIRFGGERQSGAIRVYKANNALRRASPVSVTCFHCTSIFTTTKRIRGVYSEGACTKQRAISNWDATAGCARADLVPQSISPTRAPQDMCVRELVTRVEAREQHRYV
ncbi:hypothetical protein EVAR_47423_1 [Eumeta japonica]|uniref:Uncharacterized protein n=1 Tax=Eumeta variegata TaxID=151549 RepID=A0A4C1XZV5_EUMVA|nr:hypothetical protein EVAR_47423_1 [Eumeta japonica]